MVIDGGGRTLMPGLIDAHWHTMMASLPIQVLLTADVGRLVEAGVRGLAQPVTSPAILEKVPANLRDTENLWFGLTMRARVFAYDKNKVKPEELRSYNDLLSPRFKGQIHRRCQRLYR